MASTTKMNLKKPTITNKSKATIKKADSKISTVRKISEKRTEINGLKLLLLQQIDENKNILFAERDPSITKVSKRLKWQEIFNYCQSIGYPFPPDKEWEYLRDSTWPSIRDAVRTKMDKKKLTGTEGATEDLTDIDNAVSDIDGRESAIVNGLPVTESMASPPGQSTPSTSNQASPELGFTQRSTTSGAGSVVDIDHNRESPAASLRDDGDDDPGEGPSNRWMPKTKKQKRKIEESAKYQLALTKIEKMRSQISLMAKQEEQTELQNYKLKLEIMEKEDEMGLPHRFPIVDNKVTQLSPMQVFISNND